jgi:hypothetical protein
MSTLGSPWIVTSRDSVHIVPVITMDMIKFSEAPYIGHDPLNKGNRYDRYVGMG